MTRLKIPDKVVLNNKNEDHQDYDVHISGYNSTTLCGYVDVLSEDVFDREITCKYCLSIVKYCKSLKV